MRRHLRTAAVALLFCALGAVSTSAQHGGGAVDQKVAPIDLRPQVTPTPLRTAAVSTVFLGLSTSDERVNVQFNDPQFDERVGWVHRSLVRVDDPAASTAFKRSFSATVRSWCGRSASISPPSDEQ